MKKLIILVNSILLFVEFVFFTLSILVSFGICSIGTNILQGLFWITFIFSTMFILLIYNLITYLSFLKSEFTIDKKIKKYFIIVNSVAVFLFAIRIVLYELFLI